MSLLPPSEDQEFTSREAMLEALQSHARGHGYAVTTRRYNARDGALYLKCDRGGEYKPRNGLTATNRRRDTGTRLIDGKKNIIPCYTNDTNYIPCHTKSLGSTLVETLKPGISRATNRAVQMAADGR